MVEEIPSEKPPIPDEPQIIEELPRAAPRMNRVIERSIRHNVMSTAQKQSLRKWGYSFLFVNSFIMIMTSALMAIVLYLESYFNYFDPFLMIYIQSPGITLMIMSSILLSTTIFGYYVWFRKEYYVWLGIMLITMIMFQSRFIIAGLTYQNKASDHVGKSLSYSMAQYSNNTELQISVDILQVSLSCCGKNNFFEWFNTTTGDLPWSCCPKSPSGHFMNCLLHSYVEPCLPKLLEIPKLGIFIVFSILGLVIMLEVILILVLRMMTVISTIRRRRR